MHQCFVLDKKSHPVAEVEQFRCRWIMAVLIALHPSPSVIQAGAQGPRVLMAYQEHQIMMIADSLNLDSLPFRRNPSRV